MLFLSLSLSFSLVLSVRFSIRWYGSFAFRTFARWIVVLFAYYVHGYRKCVNRLIVWCRVFPFSKWIQQFCSVFIRSFLFLVRILLFFPCFSKRILFSCCLNWKSMRWLNYKYNLRCLLTKFVFNIYMVICVSKCIVSTENETLEFLNSCLVFYIHCNMHKYLYVLWKSHLGNIEMFHQKYLISF